MIVNSAKSAASVFSKHKPKMTKPEDFLSKDFQKVVREIFGEAQDAEPKKQSDRASLIDDAKAKGLRGPW